MIEAKLFAVAAIWIGVGIGSFGTKENTPAVAFFAMIATFFVVSH